MKRELLLSTIAGSVVLATGLLPSTGAKAADTVPVKAPAMSVADTWWYFHGDVEAGGRFFLNDPQRDGLASRGQKALGKYYEYSDIRPGPFLYGWLSAGSNNGLYRVDLWADNVGYEDQRYQLDASKAGEYYLDFTWDQTPHIYSTNALTMYQGLGSGALTLPAGVSNALFNAAGCVRHVGAQPTGCTSGNPSAAQVAAIQTILNNNLYTTDIGIRRDTASVAFRWTPTDAWDVNVDYSNMHRHGTQVEGVVFSPGTSGVAAQVPKPVDDTTQNFGVNGEYKGTSPWGQLLTWKVGYAGSIYDDALSSYTVENPFCATGSGVGECARNGSPSSPLALMTLWPDNSAHGFTSTVGADLPFKSRYMGTVTYTMMRQNQNFVPSPFAFLLNAANTGLVAAPGLPAASLNGAIDTVMSNNVLTTQITSDLKSKLSYRYYNFDNRTPELLFPDWTLTDVKRANDVTAAYAPVSSLAVAYTKQNAGADLVWSPMRQWNIGGGYEFERYTWRRADADATNQNGGKVFVDYKPWTWVTARASYLVADRRYENYGYRGNVGNFQWSDPLCIVPGSCSVQYSQAMRQFYLDNRDRQIGKFSVSVDVARGLTITPTVIYQDDHYAFSDTEAGLTRSQVVKAGVEVGYAIAPTATLLFSYMNEQYRQNVKFTTAANIQPVTAANTWHADVRDNINTFMAAANWAAIPDKLDLRVSYTVSLSTDSQPLISDSGVTPTAATGGQLPDVKGQWSRLEAQAKYTFDKDAVSIFGLKGQAYAKLRYVWERNSINNFDQDIMQAYMDPLINNTGFMTWTAFDNPNYNVHLIGASLGLKW
jgi:MtrB/PioB family decaheme-associated outer membrane protein